MLNDVDLHDGRRSESESADLSQADLLNLYAKIQAQLAGLSLEHINLEQELLIQYQTLKLLLQEVWQDDKVALNQKAQLANSITSILTNLVKTQTDLYNAERIKKIEFALIETLKNSDKLIKDDFFDRYQRALQGVYE